MLKEKILTNTAYNLLSQIISFISGMILARLLFPSDYGIFSISLMITEIVTCLSLSSFAVALVQKKQTEDSHYSSICITSLLITFFLMSVIYFKAKIFANFFQMPELQPVLKLHIIVLPVIALELLFNPFLVKELKFKELGIAELFFAITKGVFAIICAKMNLGVFSLVIGYIAGKTVRLFVYVSYIGIARFKILKYFSFQKLKELSHVGIGITCQNIFLFVTTNIDYMLLGKMTNKFKLGIYQKAYRLISLPVFQISQNMSRVLLPAFAKEQENNKEIENKINIATQFAALIIFPSFTFVFLNAEFLINLIFGKRWQGTVAPLKILLFAGAIKSVSTFIGDALKAKGVVFKEFCVQLIQAVILFVGGYFGIKHYGIPGIVYVVVASSFIFWTLMLIILKQTIGLNISKYIHNIFLVIILSLIGSSYHLLMTLIYYKFYTNQIIHFILSLSGCIIIYIIYISLNLKYFLIAPHIKEILKKYKK